MPAPKGAMGSPFGNTTPDGLVNDNKYTHLPASERKALIEKENAALQEANIQRRIDAEVAAKIKELSLESTTENLKKISPSEIALLSEFLKGASKFTEDYVGFELAGVKYKVIKE